MILLKASEGLNIVDIVENVHSVIHVVPAYIAFMLAYDHFKYKNIQSKSIKNPGNEEYLKKLSEHAENKNARKIHDILLLLSWLTLHLSMVYFINVKRMEANISSIELNLGNANNTYLSMDSCLVSGGIDAVYPMIHQALKSSRKSPDEFKEIHILGFTLLTVQPQLDKWIQSGFLDKRSLYLYYLDPNYMLADKCIDTTWVDDANHFVKQIMNSLDKYKDIIKENSIEIQLVPYKHLPAVHGFKLGTGKYYMAFANWDKSGTIVRPSSATYLHFESNNKSQYSILFRTLFDEWLNKAHKEIV